MASLTCELDTVDLTTDGVSVAESVTDINGAPLELAAADDPLLPNREHLVEPLSSPTRIIDQNDHYHLVSTQLLLHATFTVCAAVC